MNEPHAPLKVRFPLTGRCTARCAYCHNEGQAKAAALETAGRLPDEIILSVGEPTLSRELGAIARLGKSPGAMMSLDTLAGHPKLLEAALPYLDEIKIHIDSFDPVMQRRRMGTKRCSAEHNPSNSLFIGPDAAQKRAPIKCDRAGSCGLKRGGRGAPMLCAASLRLVAF